MFFSRKKQKRIYELREENRRNVNEALLSKLKNNNYPFDSYFAENHIKTIAIYGAGAVGRELCRQFKKEIPIEYFLDKFENADFIEEVKALNFRYDIPPEVDALIITPCHEKEFIKFDIMNYYTDNSRFFALDEILNKMEESESEA